MVPGQELALHTDVPEFRGANRKLHPQWLLVAMRHSGLFEDWRMPIATGVAADGNREVLGVDVGDSEDEVFWTAFLRRLRDRGLSGVRLVISDAHSGLKAAIGRVLAGAACLSGLVTTWLMRAQHDPAPEADRPAGQPSSVAGPLQHQLQLEPLLRVRDGARAGASAARR
jgi:hypothetical protein